MTPYAINKDKIPTPRPLNINEKQERAHLTVHALLCQKGDSNKILSVTKKSLSLHFKQARTPLHTDNIESSLGMRPETLHKI